MSVPKRRSNMADVQLGLIYDIRQGKIQPESARKLRGGYYTPTAIAEVLAGWAIRKGDDRVLEPSAGDGNLVVAAQSVLNNLGTVEAVEFDPAEADKIRERADERVNVWNADFFTWLESRGERATFDAVLGNPPFIRYQHFKDEHRASAFRLLEREGLKPNRLTNAWVPFVVGATVALRDGGCLALVVPAELLQVGYAAGLRDYLVRHYASLTVVTFRELVFDGILQETVLLLGVRGNGGVGGAQMSVVELNNLDDLDLKSFISTPYVSADLDHAREKWTQYFLSPSELALVRHIEASGAFTRLGALASVDVGIVTGRNPFFILSQTEAKSRGLYDSCIRLVGRSAQIPGLLLRDQDWVSQRDADARVLLLQLGNVSRDELTPSARRYVEFGEESGIDQGYKCRIRKPNWWKIPSTWVPDAFLLRQVYDAPRIILNQAGATSTDTIHRVRVNHGVDASLLAATSLNSLTCAFSEIHGRSYGGGVLELEPTEAEGLPYPKLDGLQVDLDGMDKYARLNGYRAAMREVDSQILRGADLSASNLDMLHGLWKKMSDRRLGRKR